MTSVAPGGPAGFSSAEALHDVETRAPEATRRRPGITPTRIEGAFALPVRETRSLRTPNSLRTPRSPQFPPLPPHACQAHGLADFTVMGDKQ
jgi:hypothetical protein